MKGVNGVASTFQAPDEIAGGIKPLWVLEGTSLDRGQSVIDHIRPLAINSMSKAHTAACAADVTPRTALRRAGLPAVGRRSPFPSIYRISDMSRQEMNTLNDISRSRLLNALPVIVS